MIGARAAEQIDRGHAPLRAEQRKELAVFVRRCPAVDAVDEQHRAAAAGLRREDPLPAPIPEALFATKFVGRERTLAHAPVERGHRARQAGPGCQRTH
jgi:hypothetical protein